MAEFTEIMHQAKRMCIAHNSYCFYSDCPLDNGAACRINVNLDGEDYNELERIIMDWAKENPEIVYPSWEEWHRNMFPNSDTSILPCWFMPRNPVMCNTLENCEGCRNHPIPAEIAKKLGIKPKEGM